MHRINLCNFLTSYSSVYVRQLSSTCSFKTSKSWVVLTPIEQKIKNKIEVVGVPLKDWNINIYRGILTGYNEAFIIDGKKKDELIATDPKSAEIIRPILRGRDIKQYTYEFADLYLIATFPVKDYSIDDFPAVKEHLLSFGYDRLKQTGDLGARKKTNNKWFETQDSINYWEELFKQKIIWGEISDRTKFCIDKRGEYVTEATTFLLTGESLLYLLGFLNSRLSEYMFSQIGTTTGVGTVRWKKYTIEQLRVPRISNEEQEKYIQIVNQIIEKNSKNECFTDLLKEIDNLIYNEFGFTTDEIEIIKNHNEL